MSKRYVGIDVHKKLCVFTELNAVGNVTGKGSFRNDIVGVSDFTNKLHRGMHLVLEPVLNYLWLLDQFELYAGSVHVATPYKVRIIAESKCKTDSYDSRMLAELLRTNFLPESWVPPKELRSLRTIIRQRYHLVKTMVGFKNRVRYLLFTHGIRLRMSDISCLKAKEAISGLCLPDATSSSIVQCLEIIEELKGSIKELDNRVEEASEGVGVIVLLKTIPGMGRIWSATIYAEIGDIRRFGSRKALASYTGLVPSVRSSGESCYRGGITHLGSKPLRHALVEVAIRASRQVPSLNRMYNRVLYRSNVQKARVAVARKLAVIIYAMLRNNEPFRLESA
jgi:transposase